jgi:hypothetical protein
VNPRVLLFIQLVAVTVLGPACTARLDGSPTQVLLSIPVGIGTVLAMHLLFAQIDRWTTAPEASSEASINNSRPILGEPVPGEDGG